MKTTHTYDAMSADNRPQDPSLRGHDLKFEAMEHGGIFRDCFPNAIRITDKEGRHCTFVPVNVNGESVISGGFANR